MPVIESASTLEPGEFGVGSQLVKVSGVKSFLMLSHVGSGMLAQSSSEVGCSLSARENSAAVLGFVEVDSLGNDRGNSWVVETGLSPECEDSEG